MAIHARSHPGLFELLAVSVVVASLALQRRGGKVRFHQPGLHVRRFVAINTSRRFVRSGQRERGFRVVKALQIFPVLGGMAGLAPKRRAVAAQLLHAFGELPLVRILVAGLAIQILPVIEHHRLWLCIGMLWFFVAIGARDRDVAAG